MSEKRTALYEAMFMISQSVAADLKGAIAHIDELLGRAHAQTVAMRKWDERRLAYEIDGQKRALYILCYFKAPTTNISHLERDCNLSEKILRTLILRAEHMTEEQAKEQDARKDLEAEAKMRAERPAAVAPAAQPAPEGTPA